jgi:hypothetical protein
MVGRDMLHARWTRSKTASGPIMEDEAIISAAGTSTPFDRSVPCNVPTAPSREMRRCRISKGGRRMIVTHVSRGKITIEDGSRHYEAHGEALMPTDPAQTCYVVYLNSFFEIGADGSKAAAAPEPREMMIECITAWFAARNTVVEFE